VAAGAASVVKAQPSSTGIITERRAQTTRKLDRVIVRLEMHKGDAWLLGQHVTVNGRSNVALSLLDDFGPNQHDVAGDGGLTLTCWRETNARGDAHRPRRTASAACRSP
jgi:hypothetical protein